MAATVARRRRGAALALAKAFAWAAVLAVVVGAGVFLSKRGPAAGLDAARACAADAVGAALLLDVAKPVPPGTSDRVLRDVGGRLAAGVELRVYAAGPPGRVPRTPMGKLCRPYAQEALQVAAAKDGLAVRDCDDLPAQIPPELRTAAARYCDERVALALLIDGLRPAEDRPVEAGDLMAAIEAAIRDLGDDSASVLYVASDMLQHAERYSHLDLEWTEWRFLDFETAIRADGPPVTGRPDGLEVRVLYLPRRGLTDARRVRDAHWAFWRHYFAPAEVFFEARATAAAYEAAERMDLAGAVAAVARERAEAAVLKREADDELRTVREALDALAAAAREADADTADLVARVAGVRREREAAENEQVRLQAAWNARVEARPPPVADVAVPATTAACVLRLREPSEAERGLDAVGNYGAGTVVVRYAVAADGVPITGSLAVDRDRSNVTHAEHFDAIADDALRMVGDWRFDVACGTRGAVGADGQPATATLSYRQKCAGAPIPRCRTVFAEAVL